MKKQQEKNVLVVALSTFPNGNQKNKISAYIYKEKKEENNKEENKKDYKCFGYYQLSPIPHFIKNYRQICLTDAILLETEQTKEDKEMQYVPELLTSIINEEKSIINDEKKDINCYPKLSDLEKFQDQLKKYLKDHENKISAHTYYELFLKALFPNINIIKIDINLNKIHLTLYDLQEKIINLYNDFTNTTNDSYDNWHLFFDTHGSFRDVSVICGTAARFLATKNDKPIKTTGIYSILFSDNRIKDSDNSSEYSLIVDQTSFYLADSYHALKDYLDYGQYLIAKYEPYEGQDPYCFISYRHDEEHYSQVRNVFSCFHDENIKFWFDDGLRAGQNWDDQLREKVLKCQVFICLFTQSYIESGECWKEIIRAYNAKKIIYCIKFDSQDIHEIYQSEKKDKIDNGIKYALNYLQKNDYNEEDLSEIEQSIKDFLNKKESFNNIFLRGSLLFDPHDPNQSQKISKALKPLLDYKE